MFYRILTLAVKWCLNKMYLIHLDNINSPGLKVMLHGYID